eukprot:ctg_2227.g436
MTTTPFSPDRLSAEARRRLVHALTSFRERFSLSRREWATHSSDELVDEAADAITWLVKAYDEAVAVFNNHSPAGIPKRVRFAEVSNDDATAPTPNQAKVDGSEVSAVAPTDAPGLSPPSSMPLRAAGAARGGVYRSHRAARAAGQPSGGGASLVGQRPTAGGVRRRGETVRTQTLRPVRVVHAVADDAGVAGAHRPAPAVLSGDAAAAGVRRPARALGAVDWPHPERLAVRVGGAVHTGRRRGGERCGRVRDGL